MSFELYNEDCVDVIDRMQPESVDLVVTSPPYWNQKEYSFWPTYQDYLISVQLWVSGVARILKPGRHCFWVIPDKLPWPPKENETGERLYAPIYSDTERIASRCGLVCKFPIIWKKPHATQKMFGSYPFPPTIIPSPSTERICSWRKLGKPDLVNKGESSRLSSEEWTQWAQDLWEINPETNSFHPAPFPKEIPYRLIKLWSFVGDTVFDPFTGSGTTGIVAMELDRSFVGAEKNFRYYARAKQCIETARDQLRFDLGDE